MAMARKLTAAMAVKALPLLAALALFFCAANADVHASMPALAAHLREIQRLAKTARGEVEVDKPDLVGSRGAVEPVGAEDEVPQADPASQLFAHIREMQQRTAERLESLNSEDETESETEGIMEIVKEEEEKEVDPGGVVDEMPEVDAGSQLFVHIREMQRKAAEKLESLNGEDETETKTEGIMEIAKEEEEKEVDPGGVVDEMPDVDAGSQLFVHIREMQQKAAEKLESLNGEDETETETEGITEIAKEEEEKEVDPGGVVDALVQKRFSQLESALKFLNDKDGAEWSEDGAQDDDAINLLHQFVRERQQKKSGLDAEVKQENDQSHKAFVEHGELGDRNKHSADFSGFSDAHYRNHDHQHGESSKEEKFILPEEIAEEEDLLQLGFERQKYPSVEHLSRSRGPELGVWLRAMGCSLLVSLASLICLVLLPCIVSNGKPSETVVNTLASFGAGAMLGDAFLHQLPHAFGKSETRSQGVHHHDHDHSHPHANGHDHILSAAQGHAHSLQDLSIGLAVLGGILLFFIVEKIVRRYEELTSNNAQRGGHSHHYRKKKNKSKKSETPEKIAAAEELVTLENKESSFLETTSSDLKKRKSGKKKDAASVGNVVPTTLEQQVEASGAFVIGYLNLFSDAVHNFTDGMALGSAFSLYGTVGGWSRTLFLLAHELPQEVGDFGILVKSGFSVFEALAFNFLSALVALAGTAVALMLGGSWGHSSLIEAFIAGGFIYMSVGGVMPSMHHQGSSLTSTLSQLFPMVFGIAVAIVISFAE